MSNSLKKLHQHLQEGKSPKWNAEARAAANKVREELTGTHGLKGKCKKAKNKRCGCSQ